MLETVQGQMKFSKGDLESSQKGSLYNLILNTISWSLS